MTKKHDPQSSKKAKNTTNKEKLTPSKDTEVNAVAAETATVEAAENAPQMSTNDDGQAPAVEVTAAAKAETSIELQERIEEGKKLTILYNKRNGQYWYKMGSIGLLLMDKAKYKDGAVSKFADACDIDETTLRHHFGVVRRWKAVEFDALLKQGLSLAHLDKLAGVDDDAVREALIARVLAEKLSSKALGLLIKESKTSKDGQDDDAQEVLAENEPDEKDVSDERVARMINDTDKGITRLIQKMAPLLTSQQGVSPMAVERLRRLREEVDEKIDALLEQVLKQTNTMLPVIAAASTLHPQ